MAHVASTSGKFQDCFFDILTMTSMDVYGKATDEVKEAAAGFAPVHNEQFDGFSR
jgi:hypothetical protein